MPELPEVETTKKSLEPLLQHKVIDLQVYQPQLRWQMPNDLTQLCNEQLVRVDRRAKYLILTFSNPQSKLPRVEKKLLIHLGMSGSLQQHKTGTQKRKHDHLIMTFEDDIQLHYHDPRRFGSILWYEQYADKLLNHLGVEPLSEYFNADYLYHIIHKNHKVSRSLIQRPIKSVIMEQKIVVGVGNIYATESLFLSNIHPATPAHLLTQEQLAQLVKHIKTILAKAIQQGGSTLKDFTTGAGKTGYFQQTLLAYGRQNQPCVCCQTPLQNIKLNGRASVFCPKCQPLIP